MTLLAKNPCPTVREGVELHRSSWDYGLGRALRRDLQRETHLTSAESVPVEE